MGKAARNERVKLDAMFLNNLAVGLVLAGIFLPLFSLFRSTPDEILPFVFSVTGVLAIAGAFMIFWAAYQFSQAARKEIAKIED